MPSAARSNPYDFINDVANPSLFAGRRAEIDAVKEELLRLTASTPIAPVIALVGERRVGKTSLLHRASEIAYELAVLPCWVHLDGTTATDAWEFWHATLQAILSSVYKAGAFRVAEEVLGFRPNNTAPQPATTLLPLLDFAKRYELRQNALAAPALPPSVALSNDLTTMTQPLGACGFKGIVLFFDEAHLLVESVDLLQQLRHVTRTTNPTAVLFSGEPALNKMFSDPTAPFYLQARIVPVGNFLSKADIAECAILPLTPEERLLLSPMTVDYLARLSQGKPNQIRLICHSIYDRYLKGDKNDLDITLEALDGVLDVIQTSYASEYDLRDRVETIRRLNSTDLEALYLATRFPNWRVDDVVLLDEAFRGEELSPLAAQRRTLALQTRHARFVELQLLQDRTDRYILSGDEFLYMYLRLWYEVRKYGRVRRRLNIGEAPLTPFSEKVDKLIRSVAWEMQQPIELTSFAHGASDMSRVELMERVKSRYVLLDRLLASPREVDLRGAGAALAECLSICQLLGKPGRYHLLVVAVRSLENPRESVIAEIYFRRDGTLSVPLSSFSAQAEAAKTLIEEFEVIAVTIPGLSDLFQTLSGSSLENFIENEGPFAQWSMKAIRRVVENADDSEKSSTADDDPSGEWIEAYRRGDSSRALTLLAAELAKEPRRSLAARLYNDQGYIAYGVQGQADLAKRSLERALNLHHYYLPITLLNLAVIAIDDEEFEAAISFIEDALLLTHSREVVSASHLRLRLLNGHLPMAQREKWEQNPAHVLEAAYVNLAYAVAKGNGYEAAAAVLGEGLELLAIISLVTIRTRAPPSVDAACGAGRPDL